MARFFDWLRQLTKWWFIIVGVLGTGFLILIVLAISSLKDVTTITSATPGRTVKAQPSATMLHLKLEGAVQNHRPDLDDVWAGFMGLQERQTYVDDIRRGLKKAAKDDSVKGLWVTTGPVMASTTTMNALRRLIEEYKAESKKPVQMHVSILTNPQLLLASAADSVIIPPLADIYLPGPQFQLTYLGDAIERLGFKFDVVKAGKYKSAMESMTSDEPSAASEEMYKAMVTATHGFYSETIAKGRGTTAAAVDGWFSKAVFSPEQAVKAGIANQIAYAEDHSEAFAKSLSATSYDFSHYLASDSSAFGGGAASGASFAGLGSDSPIALITAEGEISSFAAANSEGITPSKLIPKLKWALADDDIKGVVLRVNSPGGSANASDILWQEIRKLDAAKPVVVQMTDVAASGGYYLAAGARKIVADPLTITGSIGVIYAAPYGPKIKDKYGISFHGVGLDGDPRTFNEPLTDREKARLVQSIDYTYGTFLDRVATGRSTSRDKIAPLAEGRVYTGAEALNLGLVDSLGGLGTAVELVKELAEIEGNPWPLRTYSRKNPFRQAIEMMSVLQGRAENRVVAKAVAASPLGLLPDGAVKNATAWKYWAKKRVALSYWPYHSQLR